VISDALADWNEEHAQDELKTAGDPGRLFCSFRFCETGWGYQAQISMPLHWTAIWFVLSAMPDGSPFDIMEKRYDKIRVARLLASNLNSLSSFGRLRATTDFSEERF